MSEKVLVVDALTGESYERDLTPDEILQRAKDVEASERWNQQQILLEEKKKAALSKLEALGLTTDDLKALGL